jgi:2-polyprenyl-3-methyl-5-hydroxy-6-metoxy-1,4-benzoquinol methylase
MSSMISESWVRDMQEVKSFYESYPYPQLPLKNKKDVFGKLHNTVMKRILQSANLTPADLQGKRILDAGCGSGEKSVYFALHGAKPLGIDLSENSLAIARKYAEKFNAKCEFRNLDIFDMPSAFQNEKFNHVFSIGVIHHTKNAKEAARILANVVKPGGTLTLGLYNKYGRLYTRMQRAWVRSICKNDYRKGAEYVEKNILRRPFKSDAEKAYLADTYLHPHETYHSIEEVKKWFDEFGMEFIGITPEITGNEFLAQLSWLLRRRGFFTISARRKK